ncbi:hypothetical protein ACYSNW_14760 [Enterococcus sp. LJL99]
MTNEKIWQALDDDMLKENIRKRPSMFIGAVGEAGLQSMVIQSLDDLLSLASDLKRTKLAIELSENQLIFTLESEKELLLNKNKEGFSTPYLFLTIVNAFSEQMGFSIETNGRRTIKIYQAGQLKKKALIPSEETFHRLELAFTPDETVLGTKKMPYFVLLNRCQQLTMLNSGLSISLTNNQDQKNVFHYKKGLIDYIFQKDDRITRGSEPLSFSIESEGVTIQAVISKNSSTSIADSFVNGHLPADGGTHLDGFVQGTVDAINQFLKETNRLQYLTTSNFSERFDFVLSIQVKRPRYTGAIKKKIRNPELYKIVREAVFEEVTIFLKRHPAWYLS